MEHINSVVFEGIYYSISVQTKFSTEECEDLFFFPIICADVEAFLIPAKQHIYST